MSPPKPLPPPALTLSSCWATNIDSSDPSTKIFVLPVNGSHDVYVEADFNRNVLSSDTASLSFELYRPDGTSFSSGNYAAEVGYGGYRVVFHLDQGTTLAPSPGTWKAAISLNNFSPCTYSFQVEKLASPMSFTATPTSFDPNSTYLVTATWQLLQQVDSGSSVVFELISPSGVVVDTSSAYVSSYSTTGYELLLLPGCYRSSFSNYDSCTYGTYTVALVINGAVVGRTTIQATKP